MSFFDEIRDQIGTPPAGATQPADDAARPAPAVGDDSPVARFASQVAPAALAASRRLGVAPEILIGQWGLETGWGKSVIPGTNNLGNIKDFSGGGIQATDNMTGSRDAYRAYDSVDSFGDDYASLIERRYGAALGAGADAQRYADALKAGGYAEDPAYVEKMMRAAEMVRQATGGAMQGASPEGVPLSLERDDLLTSTYDALQQRDRQEAADASPLSTSLERGWEGLKHNAGLMVDNALGDAQGVAERIQYKREWDRMNPAPSSSQAFMADFDQLDDDSLAGVFGAALRNPAGALNQMVEQTPNSLPGLALQVPVMLASGALTATGWGAPLGVALQGAAAFIGNVLPEGGAFIEEELAKSGIDPNNTEAVARWAAENRDRLLQGGATKAGVISFVDGVTGYLGAKLVAGPSVKFAAADRQFLRNAGVNAADKAAVAAVRATPAYKAAMSAPAAELVAATTGAQKIGRALGSLGLESFGEGAGEYAGTYAATGDASLKEAGLEAMMGFGTSAAMTGAQAAMGALQGPDAKRSEIEALAAYKPPAPQPNSPLTNAANLAAGSVPPQAPAGTDVAGGQGSAGTATAGGQAPAGAPGAPGAEAAADPLSPRLAKVASIVEDKALISAMRSDPRFGKESVTDLLAAYAKARNPSLDPLLRTQALDSIDAFMQTFGNRPNFTIGGQQAEQGGQPRQAGTPALFDVPTPQLEAPAFAERDITPAPERPAAPELETEQILQARRNADAEYDQAFQDLVKAEQLGASDAELMEYQLALDQAKLLRADLDAELEAVQRRIEEGRKKQRAESRRAILDEILADPQTANPAARFTAELQRQGFRDIVPDADEMATIQRFENARAAVSSMPEDVQPVQADSSAQPAQPVQTDGNARQDGNVRPRVTVEQVRKAVADGAELSGNVLRAAGAEPIALQGPMLAAAREAIRRREAGPALSPVAQGVRDGVESGEIARANPEQRIRNQIARIADRWENEVGDAGMARVVRANASGALAPTQETLAFQQRKLDEALARKNGTAAPVRDDHTLETYLVQNEREAKDLRDVIAQSGLQEIYALADRAIRDAAGYLNDRGFSLRAQYAMPPDMRDIAKEVSGLAGTMSRLTKKAVAVLREYKRANPEQMQSALDEAQGYVNLLREMIGQAPAFDARTQAPTAPEQSRPEPGLRSEPAQPDTDTEAAREAAIVELAELVGKTNEEVRAAYGRWAEAQGAEEADRVLFSTLEKRRAQAVTTDNPNEEDADAGTGQEDGQEWSPAALRAAEGTGIGRPAGPWSLEELSEDPSLYREASEYLDARASDGTILVKAIDATLADRDAALGLTLPGLERPALPGDLMVAFLEDAPVKGDLKPSDFDPRYTLRYAGHELELEVVELQEGDEVLGIPPLVLHFSSAMDSDTLRNYGVPHAYRVPGVDGLFDFVDAVEQGYAVLAQRAGQSPAGAEMDADIAEQFADAADPTDGQKEAGNYQMAHVRIDGMDVSIETEKGAQRSGKDADGTAWTVTMPSAYGYIRGTKGADKDHVDIFVGPNPDNGTYYVINQMTPIATGKDLGKPQRFDEHKVAVGFASENEAVANYLLSFADDFGARVFGSISGPYTADEFKALIPALEKAAPIEKKAKKDKPLTLATPEQEAERFQLVNWLAHVKALAQPKRADEQRARDRRIAEAEKRLAKLPPSQYSDKAMAEWPNDKFDSFKARAELNRELVDAEIRGQDSPEAVFEILNRLSGSFDALPFSREYVLHAFQKKAEAGTVRTRRIRVDDMPAVEVTLPSGNVYRMNRLTAGESMGLAGWHDMDRDQYSFLGDNQEMAIATLIEREAAAAQKSTEENAAPADYEARYRARRARIEAATTIEEIDAIVAEEHSDGERHFEGTNLVEREARDAKSRLKRAEERRIKDEQDERALEDGQWVEVFTTSLGSEANAQLKKLSNEDLAHEYRLREVNDRNDVNYFSLQKRRKTDIPADTAPAEAAQRQAEASDIPEPKNWRTSYGAAQKYAEAMGVGLRGEDGKYLKLPALVAAIDAKRGAGSAVADEGKAEASGKRRGEVGMKLSPGEVVLTNTGRETTPFPRPASDLKTARKVQAHLKKVDAWLIENARAEAVARGDAFNQRQFDSMNLSNLSQADKDSAEAYLFDPDFVFETPASILKPLVSDAKDGETMLGLNAQGDEIWSRNGDAERRIRVSGKDIIPTNWTNRPEEGWQRGFVVDEYATKHNETRAKRAEMRAYAEREAFNDLSGDAMLAAVANNKDNQDEHFQLAAEQRLKTAISKRMLAAAEANDAETARAFDLIVSGGRPLVPEDFYVGLRKHLIQVAEEAKQAALKAQARDPLAAALQQAGYAPESEDGTKFIQGWEHALDGKTKSTLPNGEPFAAGYAKAQGWMATPEGKAAASGRRAKKLKNTGADLRRWFDDAKKKAREAQTDVDKLLEQLEAATSRAELLRGVLAEDATPGAVRWFGMIRNIVPTFKDWLGDKSPVSRMDGAWTKDPMKKLRYFITGEADSRIDTSLNGDESERMEHARNFAETYIENVRALAEGLLGVRTVEEGAKRLAALLSKDPSKLSDWYSLADHRSVSELGEQMRKFGFLDSSTPAKRKLGDLVWHAAAKAGYNPDRAKYDTGREGGYPGEYTYRLMIDEHKSLESSRKQALTPPRMDRVNRDGEDYRKGQDITPEQFKETFNFADVGFGQWVGARQDQDHLNYAHDAFRDLAALLNLPPKAIALAGKLHFTIGALGHGKMAAHYQVAHPHPDGGTVPVINVTNTKGDGTVAHEWAHALDLTKQSEGQTPLNRVIDQIKQELRYGYEMKPILNSVDSFLVGGSYWKGDKRSMSSDEGRIYGAAKAISYYAAPSRNKSAYFKEAQALDGSKKTDPYWSNDKEIFARAFEAWVVDRLEFNSNYLVNPEWAGEGAITGETHRGTPYPVGDERKRFNEYFDALAKSLKEVDGRIEIDLVAWEQHRPKYRQEWEAALKDLEQSLPERLRALKAQKNAEAEYNRIATEEAKTLAVGDVVVGRPSFKTGETRYPDRARVLSVEPANYHDWMSVEVEFIDGPRAGEKISEWGQQFEVVERAGGEAPAPAPDNEATDADLDHLFKGGSQPAAEQSPAPAPERSPEPAGELTEADYERLFDEAAAELQESSQEKPEVPAPGAELQKPQRFSVEDVREVVRMIEAGEMVLLATPEMGVPTIHDFSGSADHIGMGVIRARTPEFEATWTAGGAMYSLPSGEAYTTVSVNRGTFPYDREGILTTLRAALPAERTRTAPAAEKTQAAEQPAASAEPALSEEQQQSVARMAADAAKLGVKGIDNALAGLVRLFGGGPGKLMSFPGGFNEDTYKAAKPFFEEALQNFQEAGKTIKDLFAFLIQQLGLGVKPYAVQFAKDKRLSANLGEKPSASMQVADFVAGKLDRGEKFTSRELFDAADKAYGGTQAEGTYSPKDAYDGMEAGVNRWLMSKPGIKAGGSAEAAAAMVQRFKTEILEKLPTQTRRDAEMDEFQQFSTPPSLAYVASWVANVNAEDTMMEPSAGTGDLAVYAKNAGASLVLNELSSRRAEVLRGLFPQARIFTENAEQLNNILPADVRPSVVIMNPPFSATAGRIQGQRKSKNGAGHIEQALKRLAPNGRLVAIMGEGMGYDRPAFRAWYDEIQKTYNVRAVIGIDGREYAKYGTTFDNVILVIDKDGPQRGEVLTGKVDSVEALPAMLENIRESRPQLSAEDRRGQPPANQQDGRGNPGQDGMGGKSELPAPDGADEVRGGQRGGARGRRPGGASGGGGGSSRSGGNRRDGGDGGDLADGRSGGGGSSAGRGAGGQPQSDVTVEDSGGERVEGELTDSIFERYTPQRLKIPGARPHPGKLVQSAAMAAVEPPAPTYTPNLPKEVIEGGLLSDAQLEAIVYAGQAHTQELPNGDRRGFFIGDGTGVGKGREIAGIILDNMRQGRKKAVWVSFNQGLINDAKRDFGGIGGDPELIFSQQKTKAANEIAAKDGILFTTYSTLRGGEKSKDGGATAGRSRLDQIVAWLGEDFDGAIMFDEAHSMGNALPMKGKRGKKKPSAQALAGIELQARLPKARIVYVSATGATEVNNLAYASRLGLWGEGTPFPNVSQFVSQIHAGGVAAMELVARDMKAMGMYLARSLSYDGVTYRRLEHNLTDLQRDIYNELATAWQLVLNNVNAALEMTNQGSNGNAKSAAMSRFWGTHQRFFNQVITSMMTPSAIDDIQQQLDAGNAIVIQLINTNEAEQERQAAKAKDEDVALEELDFTPRQALMDYVRNAFPVAQFEERTDDNGNPVYEMVVDSSGNPVLNQEAVAARDALLKNLEMIRVPGNPIDEIVQAFGADMVAEVTGRKRRFIRETDEQGNERLVEEKRGAASSQNDAKAFQDDKKKILIFSQAGGTGYSFHADNTAKNKRKRAHYILQPGWRADGAVQGFGRTHRTNQAQEPEYALMTTDLKAQKRFVSSIARRLDQLGALTRGQRQAGAQGLFSASDNLESKYADEALDVLFTDLAQNRADGLDFAELRQQMGLDNLVDQNGVLNTSKIPEVPQFLNRLLSLTTDMQDKVFDAFERRLIEAVEYAQQNGTYDNGMATLRAETVEKRRDEGVHTDERTGAETHYVELAVTNPVRYNTFDEVKRRMMQSSNQGEKSHGWYRRKDTGEAFAFVNLGQRVNGAGQVEHRAAIMRIKGGWQYRPIAREIEQGFGYVKNSRGYPERRELYERIGEDLARELFEQQVAAAPATETHDVHMITGVILPIWDRMQGHPTIVRTQTDDGERLLGRIVGKKDLKAVLKNLGVGSTAAKLAPAEQLSRILEGDTAILANGWQIKRSTVSGEQRIEVVVRAATPGQQRELVSQGAIQERIQWQERFFIPTGAQSQAVFERIVAAKPVVDLVDPNAKADEDAQDSGAFDPTNPSILASRNVADPVAGMAPAQFRAALVERYGEKGVATLERNGILNIGTSGTPGVAAWYDPTEGRAYFDPSRFGTATDAIAAVLHEIGEHHGLPEMLGERGWKTLRERMAELAAEGDNEVAAAWAGVIANYPEFARYAKDLPAAIESDRFVHEVLAKLGESAAGRKSSVWRDLLAAINRFLLKMGVGRQINKAEIADLVEGSLKRQMRGKGTKRSLLYAAGEPVMAQISAWHGSDDADVEVVDIMFQRPFDIADYLSTAGAKAKIRDRVAGLFDTAKTFNWWQRTVGSQYSKARSDADFGRVYQSAHAFIDDVSKFARNASDKALGILPHMDTFGDVARGLNARRAWSDAKDYQAIADAVFTGTLDEKVWNAGELRARFGLDDQQIALYRQFRAATDQSLETLAASEMARAARAEDMELADSRMSMDEAEAFYVGQVQPLVDAAVEILSGLRLKHRVELEDAAGLPQGERDALIARQARERMQAEGAIARVTKLRDSFTEKAEQIRTMQRKGYAPLMRFGQYTVDVVRLDEDGKPVKDDDGEVDRPFFGMFESKAEAREAEKLMREEYPGYTVSPGIAPTESSQIYQGLSPEAAEMFARLLGTDVNDAFQTYLRQALNNRSAMKRLIHRKGMAGFANDIPRVLASFIASNARLASSNWHFGEMRRAAEAIPKHKGDVKDEAIRLMSYIQNPQEEAATVRGFLFFNFLGGSIASAIVNTTQTLSTTLPYLNQFGSAKAAKAIGGAMGAAAKAMWNGLDTVADTDLRAALKAAAEDGIIDPQEIHLLMAEARGSSASNVLGTVAGALNESWRTPAARVGRAAVGAWGSFFSLAEKYNRHVAFMAAWEVAKDMSAADFAKHGVKTRFEFARQAVIETQFDYTKASRPNWARGPIGATLFTFKTFMVNYLEFLARLPSRERAVAMAVLFMLAGLSGAPGSDDLDDMIDTIAQKLGYNWNNKGGRHAWLVDVLGKDGANFVEHGISAFIPLDVSARLGMGNLIPGTGMFKDSNTSPRRDIAEIFGPAGSVFMGGLDTFKNIGTGKDFLETVRPIAPKAINDFRQAYDIATTGEYRDFRGRRVVDADLSDAFWKAIGFHPNVVAEPKRVERMVQQSVSLHRARRAEINELWARGIVEKDAEKIAAAREKLRDWNRKNPTTPIRINPESVKSRVRAMRSTSAERLVKASSKDMRGMVTNELQVTD